MTITSGRAHEHPRQQATVPARPKALHERVQDVVHQPDAADADRDGDHGDEQLGDGAVTAAAPHRDRPRRCCPAGRTRWRRGWARPAGRPGTRGRTRRPRGRRRAPSGRSRRRQPVGVRGRGRRSRSPVHLQVRVGLVGGRYRRGAPPTATHLIGAKSYLAGQLASMALRRSSVLAPLSWIHLTISVQNVPASDARRHEVRGIEAECRRVLHDVSTDLEHVVACVPRRRAWSGWATGRRPPRSTSGCPTGWPGTAATARTSGRSWMTIRVSAEPTAGMPWSGSMGGSRRGRRPLR